MHVREVLVPDSVPLTGQVPAPAVQLPLQVVVLPQSVPLRAVVASAGQRPPTPSQRSGASQVPVEGRHSTLDPRMVQVPTEPARLQAWQSLVDPPPHVVSQHTPSTQLPFTHSTFVAHVVPSGFFAAQSVPAQ